MVKESNVFGKSKDKRVKIIKKLISENKPYPIKSILTHLDDNDYRNLHEWHLKPMKIILNGPMSVDIGNGDTLKGYSIKTDLKTLNFVLENVYTNANISSLMSSDYYQNLIPGIIDHFDTELQKQDLPPLTEFDKHQLPIFLKYSSSGLKFILNGFDYKTAFNMIDNVQKQQSEISEIITKILVKKSGFRKPTPNEINKTSTAIYGDVFDNYKIHEIFMRFVYQDYFLNMVSAAAFDDDMKDAATHYITDLRKKVEKSIK